MARIETRPTPGRGPALSILLGMAAVAAVAWVGTIWLIGASMALTAAGVPMGLRMAGAPGLASLAIFLGMWLLMMAAMMFPSAWPAVVADAAARRAAGARSSAPLFLAGYLLIWEGFGVLAYVAYVAVGMLAMADPMLGERLPLIAGAVVVAAGIYQLTPLKRGCLGHCQGAAVVSARLGASDKVGSALGSGLRHGVECLGCCGGVMVALVALGAMDLRWMIAAAAAIALEKLGLRGRLVPTLLAVGLILLGVAEALGVLGGASGMGGM